MTKNSASKSLLRARGAQADSHVSFIELFFDLVFVFAVTQLSHSLLKHLTFEGAVHTALLFVAIWWAWIATSWVTNWLDPERAPVRLLLLALMLAGLILSTSIADAFETKALTFALALVTIEVGRSLFVLWAFGRNNRRNTRNFQRIVLWQALCGVFWIVGACVDGDQRLALWAIAALLTWIAPGLGFPVPGLGHSASVDWDIDGSHLAERCSLFIIIALGESILVIGATFSEHEWTWLLALAFAIAFVGSVAMWWIYFDTAVERGSRKIATSTDPGHIARLGYTYFHLLIVAGIIVAAVGDELVLAHPEGRLEPSSIAVILGGPLFYLLGNTLFKRTITGNLPLSHLVGLGLLAIACLATPYVSLLVLNAATTAILVIVAGWEMSSVRGKPRKPAEIEG